MKAVVQRVTRAEVVVDGQQVGAISNGLLVLLAVHKDDTEAEAKKMADRVWGLRIFNDEDGKMNLAIKDLAVSNEYAVLAVSNFTIYGETAKNRRPSFVESASYELGLVRFDQFVTELRNTGCPVSTGQYGAHMEVSLMNDGPVTVILEVAPKIV